MDWLSDSFGPAFSALQVPQMADSSEFQGATAPAIHFAQVSAIHVGEVVAVQSGLHQQVFGRTVATTPAVFGGTGHRVDVRG